MSTCRTGLSQEQQRALWIEYVRKTFERMDRRVAFGGKLRNVFKGNDEVLALTKRDEDTFLVLDEYHGALEVLSDKPRHLGSIQLARVGNHISLGLFKSGTTHQYAWIG